jgi:hypothetical protein
LHRRRTSNLRSMAHILAERSIAANDLEVKTAYKILRDTRVAELVERFKPVEQALLVL